MKAVTKILAVAGLSLIASTSIACERYNAIKVPKRLAITNVLSQRVVIPFQVIWGIQIAIQPLSG